MKIAVLGLWHLGTVTAACLADLGLMVIAYDEKSVIEQISNGNLPVNEPGLDELIKKSINRNLYFTYDPNEISDCDFVWITYDTPVSEDDKADVSFVIDKVFALFSYIGKDSILISSSQLPIGSADYIADSLFQYSKSKGHVSLHKRVCCIPENLRLGAALNVFLSPDRIVVGVDDSIIREKMNELVTKITDNIVWMSVKSAEMTKHAINAFLANSVVFVNEIAAICEYYGANAFEVEKGLKSEERIGLKAYLKPGNAFAGGTLARDLVYLRKLQTDKAINCNYFDSIIQSNSRHMGWLQNKVEKLFSSVNNISLLLIGITYKSGTSTLRRSEFLNFAIWAKTHGARITIYDTDLNNESIQLLNEFRLIRNYNDLLGLDISKYQAVILNKKFIEITDSYFDSIKENKALIIDQSGLYEKEIFNSSLNSKYFRIGVSYGY